MATAEMRLCLVCRLQTTVVLPNDIELRVAVAVDTNRLAAIQPVDHHVIREKVVAVAHRCDVRDAANLVAVAALLTDCVFESYVVKHPARVHEQRRSPNGAQARRREVT